MGSKGAHQREGRGRLGETYFNVQKTLNFLFNLASPGSS